jgi:[ribosomal protein S18]-alanine N-acetyltransferase
MTSERFRVRRGNAADLQAIVAVEREVAEAPHWVDYEYAAILSTDGEVEGLVRRRLFVGEADGKLLGFAVGKVLASGGDCVAELESVVVVRAARRIGIGRVLCGEVVSWSKDQTAVALELEVRAGSIGAIALYSSMGFVVVGRRRDYYREPVEDALLMRLDLTQDE